MGFDMAALLNCPECGGKLIIRTSFEVTKNTRSLYTICKNVPNCGAVFEYHLSLAKIINPRIKDEFHIKDMSQCTIFE